MLDRIDRAILRLLVEFKDHMLSTNDIAKKVSVSPRTAKKHMEKLEQEGYVFRQEEGNKRTYKTKDHAKN